MFSEVHLTTAVLSFLPLPDLCKVKAVCVLWRQLICDDGNDELLWRHHYLQLVPSKAPLPRKQKTAFWQKKVREINGLLRRPVGTRVSIDNMLDRYDDITPRSGHGMASVQYDEDIDVVLLLNGMTKYYTQPTTYDMLHFLSPRQSHDASNTTSYLKDVEIGRIRPNHHRGNDHHGWQEVAISIGSTIYVHGGNPDRNILVIESMINSKGGVMCSTCELGVIAPHLYSTAENETSIGIAMSNHPQLDACSFTLDPREDYRMQLRTSKTSDDTETFKYHRFLIFGGKCEDEMTNALYEARVFPDWQAVIWIERVTTGDIPSPRRCHNTVLIGRELYLFGGWITQSDVFGYGSQFSNEMFILNIDTMVWRKVPQPPGSVWPSPRCQANLMPINCRQKDPNTGKYRYHKDYDSKTNEDKEYLLLFGGACHDGDLVGEPTYVPYGSVVVDLYDFHLFDIKTQRWLSLETGYRPCRGGCNATIERWDGWYLAGGMHSDPGANMPDFHSNMVRFNLDPM